MAASGFGCSMQTARCGVWDLVPWPGIEPRPPALGAWSLSRCTTREVPGPCIYLFLLNCILPNLCYWDLDFFFFFWTKKYPFALRLLPVSDLLSKIASMCCVSAHDRSLCCWCSATLSCCTLCNRMNCSMPGLPVLHYLPEFAQVHVHWVGCAIQPSYPMPPSSPFAFNLSHHQGCIWGSLYVDFFFPL